MRDVPAAILDLEKMFRDSDQPQSAQVISDIRRRTLDMTLDATYASLKMDFENFHNFLEIMITDMLKNHAQPAPAVVASSPSVASVTASLSDYPGSDYPGASADEYTGDEETLSNTSPVKTPTGTESFFTPYAGGTARAPSSKTRFYTPGYAHKSPTSPTLEAMISKHGMDEESLERETPPGGIPDHSDEDAGTEVYENESVDSEAIREGEQVSAGKGSLSIC
jgi:hypothetical protein